MPYSSLPTLNAFLNGASALLLTAGFLFIRSRQIPAHRACMVAAFFTSIAFLTSYLIYHAHHGSTPFPGTGWIRPVYFGILISHTALAVLIVPLVLRTLFLALRSRWESHRRIARWTLPLWLYVSVTGVVIYWMLYRVDWAWGCPSCSEALAAHDPKLSLAWKRSVYFLMAVPYLVFAGITGLIVRSVRRDNKRGQPPSEGV